ncbi:MAG: hypothetical protein AAFY56_08580 [Pseudomonadota bacterium]
MRLLFDLFIVVFVLSIAFPQATYSKTSLQRPECFPMGLAGGGVEHFNLEVFDGVARVMIAVLPDSQHFMADEYESVLGQDALASLMTRLYTERYSEDGKPGKFAKRCYNRLNQPVSVVLLDTSENREKARILSLARDTLTVFLRVEYLSKHQVRFVLVHYRPHLHQPAWRRWLNQPQPFWLQEGDTAISSLFKDKEELTRGLTSFIVNKIH